MDSFAEKIFKENRKQDGSKEKKVMVNLSAIWRKIKKWRKKK